MTKKCYAEKRCERCGRSVKRGWHYKNMLLCYPCYQKSAPMVKGGTHTALSLKKALAKTYEINGFKSKKGDGRAVIVGYRSFPQILIGHKVKLVLME